MAKKPPNQLPPDTKIEVLMRKEMTVAEYHQMIDQAKSKGWTVQGFQKGFAN